MTGGPILTPGLHDGPRWRPGRKNPHCIYLQWGQAPSDADQFVGSLNAPGDVQRAVEAVNLLRAGMCGEFDVLHTQLAGLISERDQLRAEKQALHAALIAQRGGRE